MTIRLKLPPNAAAQGGERRWERGRIVAELPCIGAVLSARSVWFEEALHGQSYKRTGRIDLNLENEQEAEDFKLLIKLSYTNSYTHDDGVLLPHAIRLRLAVLAHSFKMEDCTTECLGSLTAGILLEEVITCMDGIPAHLLHHHAIATLKQNVITALAGGIEERAAAIDKLALEKKEREHAGQPVNDLLALMAEHKRVIACAGDALAVRLGPVDGLFEPGPCVFSDAQEGSVSLYKLLPLAPVVRVLGPKAFEAVLCSDALQCYSENDTYFLLTSWLELSPNCPKGYGYYSLDPVFKQLARHLRFAGSIRPSSPTTTIRAPASSSSAASTSEKKSFLYRSPSTRACTLWKSPGEMWCARVAPSSLGGGWRPH